MFYDEIFCAGLQCIINNIFYANHSLTQRNIYITRTVLFLYFIFYVHQFKSAPIIFKILHCSSARRIHVTDIDLLSNQRRIGIFKKKIVKASIIKLVVELVTFAVISE